MIGCLRFFILTIWTLGGTGVVWWYFNGIWAFLTLTTLSITSVIIVQKTSEDPKNITPIDIGLPLLISIFCGLVFMPISLVAGNLFSPVTCIGSGILLSVCLWKYKAGAIKQLYLYLPFATFIYECLPIDLPTDIDNILGLAANGANLYFAFLNPPFRGGSSGDSGTSPKLPMDDDF